jgi:hypothetical protein
MRRFSSILPLHGAAHKKTSPTYCYVRDGQIRGTTHIPVIGQTLCRHNALLRPSLLSSPAVQPGGSGGKFKLHLNLRKLTAADSLSLKENALLLTPSLPLCIKFLPFYWFYMKMSNTISKKPATCILSIVMQQLFEKI